MDAVIFATLLFTTCSYAAVWGGAPERFGAGMLLAAALSSLAVMSQDAGFQTTEWGVLAVDVALFLGLLALALRANRYWCLWLTSLQFVTVWTHLAFITLEGALPWAYAFASVIWSFPMLVMLAVGTLRHRRRKARYIVDPPWSGC